MNIVKIDGGLGNQMFQYAFYLHIKEINSKTKLDLSVYNSESFHHGYEIEKAFDINAPVATKYEVNKLAYYETNKLTKKLKKLYLLKPKKSHYIEKCLGFDTDVSYRNGIYYDGFWQSYKYFYCISEKVLQEFQFTKDNNPINNKLKVRMCNENSIAIHVRRADFLNVKNSHFVNLSSINYYKEAIKLIETIITNQLTFYIFTDDLQWAREYFPSDGTVFVDWNRGENSFRDMELMSYCRGIITANSTFSWWGAYLNPRRIEKIVIIPSRWYEQDKVNGRIVDHSGFKVGGWYDL